MLRVLAPRLLPKGYSLNHATNVLVANQKCVPTWSFCPTRDLSSGKLGPDRLLPATSFTTTDSNGAVQIRTHDHPSSEYPTKSVYTLLKETAERVPERTALAVKRDDVWIKWTYKEYFEDVQTIAKGIQENCQIAYFIF